jgi:hypothetical protein
MSGCPLDFFFFSRNIIPMFSRLQNLTFIKKKPKNNKNERKDNVVRECFRFLPKNNF